LKGSGLGVALILVMVAPAARAQTAPPPPSATPIRIEVLREPRTLIVGAPADEEAPAQHPSPPLTPDQVTRLAKAREIAQSGATDRARHMLLDLLREAPHHREILHDLARIDLASRDFAAIEKLARSERAATHDSLLLGRELEVALERLGHPRDAAQVTLEVWMAAPMRADWAAETLNRLATTDPRGVSELVRQAADRAVGRADLARTMAQLEWRMGDAKGAARSLASAERAGQSPSIRWAFGEELIRNGSARDSSGAIETFLSIARDTSLMIQHRGIAARRVWDLERASGKERLGAPLIAQALDDVPTERWPADVLAGVTKGLREAGFTTEARRLLDRRPGSGTLPPELAIERALADLRDGPPEKVLSTLAPQMNRSPEAMFRYAEALFFAGLPDSALTIYKQIAENPDGSFAGAALERIYLIEDGDPRSALPVFGRMAYEEWRGDDRRALGLADSLYRTLGHGALWAHSAIALSDHRVATGDFKGALEPLIALAESLPQDRLAPLARARAGDIYLERLKDPNQALAQYEECLARYPRSWNAPEVRRKLEKLRREGRF
jgi:tetratricopeptide (TPR) repeat protein